MKIVCDACQAKYSISDDKVQGKVFKIRCKKCSNIIVVRGGAQAAEPAAAPAEKDTRVYDYGYEGGGGGGGGDEAVWHLVINQDQVGPMTAAEVQQKFASGEVDADTFCWREGFADWLPLVQVDAFASLAGGGGGAHVPSGGGGQAAVAAMFGGGEDVGTSRSDPADLFAAASAGSSKSHADDDDGNDLFGAKPAAASSAAASAAQQKLRGERNENSVLFSLNNLAQLASNSPAPAPAASSSSAGHATGAAGGEGSGLIDIRSMASAYLGGSAGGAKPAAASSGIGSIDDLPVFGGGGFSEPAVIMPTVARSRDNKVLYLMIGAVGLLAITAVVMVVILLKGNKAAPQVVASADKATDSDKGDKDKDKDKDTKPSGGDSTAAGAGSAAADSSGSAAPAAADNTAPTGAAAPAAANTASKTPAPATATHTAATHTESHSGGTSHQQVAAAPHNTGGNSPPPAPKGPDKAAAADSGGGGCDEVSCVLNNYDGACCAKFRKGGNKAPSGGGGAPAGGGGGASGLPDLDRSMISSAIGAVKGRAMACGDKSSAKGMVKVHVKVDPSGHISSVSVSQTPDPALGACVAAAVQKASFPKTSQGGSFSYPFPF